MALTIHDSATEEAPPTMSWKPKIVETVDPPMGEALVPKDESQHAVHPANVVVPDGIQDADDRDLITHMIDDGEGIVEELQQGAMHARLQSLVVHFRHVLAEARMRFLGNDADADGSGPGTTAATVLAAFALMIATMFWVPTGSHAQILSPSFPAQNNAIAAAAGPAGTVTNPSGNNIAVSPGPVYCQGGLSYIHNTQFTLTGPPAIPAVTSQSGQSQLFYIFYSCASDQMMISVNPPPNNTGVPIATVLQTNAAGSLSYTITDIRPVFLFPNSADYIIPFGPGDCAWNATGTLGATTGLNLQNIGASLVAVNEISTTAAGATVDTLTCNIHTMQRTTAGKGVAFLNDCVIYYGVQTTALTTLGAPTLNTITMPAPGTAETPSTVTPVSLGAVTVTPVVGSANLSTTTAGAFVDEKIALNTPVALNTDLQSIILQQAFNQSAAAAQLVNTPGGVCHATMVLN